ncbi:hypothetical protein BT93_L0319 [Corymbia citriodora subsp. variegata]|uniref:Uncharacterized protein n=1 Tax=Corymbia citriodora subsp. variegata TaxID=360336 RepID=A0A8T0CTX5_CORYI|nr:hypothetical protein BT93_L0319 [Corymbia citriodora subsp. variegata]
MLNIEGCDKLAQIHPSIGEAKGLVYLDLRKCEKLQELPQEMGKLEELKGLYISKTAIEEIPPCIGSLKKLEVLDVSGCRSLVGLPDSINHLVILSTLDLSACIGLQKGIPNNSEFDNALNHCFNLSRMLDWWTKLNLSDSGISELPESIGKTISRLSNLEELDATGCKRLGEEIHIDGLSSLRILQLSSTLISGFSDAFNKLSHLEKVNLCNCNMLQSLPSLQHLQLTCCDNLQSLPQLPTWLTVLEVTYQQQALPQLSHQIHLKELILIVTCCRLLESMPELPLGILKLQVHGCDKLRKLPSLSGLKFLSKLDLAWCNELTEIKGLEALKSLAKLSLSVGWKLPNLDGLEQLESLRSLHLIVSHESDASLVNDAVLVRVLNRLKNLEELWVYSCKSLVRPDLLQLTYLKRLRFWKCHNLVELTSLERSKNLEELDIVGCTSIETLPDLFLKELDITGCSKLSDVRRKLQL